MKFISDKCDIRNELEQLGFLNKTKRVVIFAKGPTFQNIEKGENDIFIAINQAANVISNYDILVFNDIEMFNAISTPNIMKSKVIFCPYYPHMEGRANASVTVIDIIKKLETIKYEGILIPYNLHSGIRKPDNVITLKSGHLVTSSGITATLFAKELLGFNEVTSYGMTVRKQKKGNTYYSNQFEQKKYNHGFIDGQIMRFRRIEVGGFVIHDH